MFLCLVGIWQPLLHPVLSQTAQRGSKVLLLLALLLFPASLRSYQCAIKTAHDTRRSTPFAF